MRVEMKYPPKLGWPERILAVAVAILVLFVGLTLGIVILGILGAVAAVVGVRLWWLRRRLRREGLQGEARIIETHYEVVEEQHLLPPPNPGKRHRRRV